MKSRRSIVPRSAARSRRRRFGWWWATGPTATRTSPGSWKAAAAPECLSICGTGPAERPKSCRRCSPRRCLSPALGRLSASRAGPDFLARDPGFEHSRLIEFLGIDRADVAVDEDEVGPFAGLEAADAVLGETRVSRAAGESAERRLE